MTCEKPCVFLWPSIWPDFTKSVTFRFCRRDLKNLGKSVKLDLSNYFSLQARTCRLWTLMIFELWWFDIFDSWNLVQQMNHSDKDSDWLIVKCFISVQSMLTTLLFALEIKFVLKIEKNVLLSCSSRFLRAFQQNRAQARLFYLLFIISLSLEKGNVKINSKL